MPTHNPKKCIVEVWFWNEINLFIFLQSSSSHIYLNLTTLECRDFTVQLTAQGFQIVAEAHDTVQESSNSDDDEEERDFFETPYSLLNKISPGYSDAFGNNLLQKLQIVQDEQEAEWIIQWCVVTKKSDASIKKHHI